MVKALLVLVTQQPQVTSKRYSAGGRCAATQTAHVPPFPPRLLASRNRFSSVGSPTTTTVTTFTTTTTVVLTVVVTVTLQNVKLLPVLVRPHTATNCQFCKAGADFVFEYGGDKAATRTCVQRSPCKRGCP